MAVPAPFEYTCARSVEHDLGPYQTAVEPDELLVEIRISRARSGSACAAEHADPEDLMMTTDVNKQEV